MLSRPPGWEGGSWGYHGDDGNCFHNSNCGKNYGPKYTTGDVVGCGINFNTGCIFFTKNGHNLGMRGPSFLLHQGPRVQGFLTRCSLL